MDYSGQPSRSWLGTDWDNGNTSGGSLIATPTENCEVVDIKKTSVLTVTAQQTGLHLYRIATETPGEAVPLC